MGEVLAVVAAVILVIVFYGGLFALSIGSYVLQGLGILRASTALGFRNGWLGFIPYAAQYQLGRLAGEVELGEHRIRSPGLWMMLLPLVMGSVFAASYIALLLGVGALAATASFSGYYHNEAAVAGIAIFVFIGYIVLLLIIYAISVLTTLISLLVYHRIFTYFYSGQRPIFYMLLCAFIPLASGILLMRAARQPVIHLPTHADYAWQRQHFTG